MCKAPQSRALNSDEPEGTAPISSLTERPREMVKAAMEREVPTGHGLRVGVVGGGCSGFQYHLGFERHPGEDDAVFELDGVRVFVDAASRPHLQG